MATPLGKGQKRLRGSEPIDSFHKFFLDNCDEKIRGIFNQSALFFSKILKNEVSFEHVLRCGFFIKNNHRLITAYYQKHSEGGYLYGLSPHAPYGSKVDLSLEQLCRNMANFCGVDGHLKGQKLLGGYRHVAYYEILRHLNKTGLHLLDRAILKSVISLAFNMEFFFVNMPFERAMVKIDLISNQMIKVIKSGKPVIIPLGYRGDKYAGFGHYVDVVFWRDQLAICNRGAKMPGTGNLLFYKYRVEKLNVDVIKYLVLNFFAYSPAGDLVGPLHQEAYLYRGLIGILESSQQEFHFKSDLSAKSQKVGNCSKATPMFSFRIALFYSMLSRGVKLKEAIKESHRASKSLSTILRRDAIERVEEKIDAFDPESKTTVEKMLDIAKGKLGKRAPLLAGAGAGFVE